MGYCCRCRLCSCVPRVSFFYLMLRPFHFAQALWMEFWCGSIFYICSLYLCRDDYLPFICSMECPFCEPKLMDGVVIPPASVPPSHVVFFRGTGIGWGNYLSPSMVIRRHVPLEKTSSTTNRASQFLSSFIFFLSMIISDINGKDQITLLIWTKPNMFIENVRHPSKVNLQILLGANSISVRCVKLRP